jgi:O-acetyl-ADP-ribose deacetylase (regulator of RNase III)
LITKEKYWNKPTYETLRQSLESMKQEMLFFDGMVTKLAIPKIGCGLDRLQWDKVKEIIKDVFNDMEVEILVCYL